MLGRNESADVELLTTQERKEFAAFRELLWMTPGLEAHIMQSSGEEITLIADLIQNGSNGARADDTKGMKSATINWITPKGHGFNHERTGALLCLASLDWANSNIRSKLITGQIQPSGDQWPVFLYANYTYDAEDPWNGLLRSSLLISAYKHIFTSPSSIDQEPRATRSGNTWIHGM
ncbi:hypothetical protein JVT61DRAFT_10876 [Boletus reticuloceps]|uniref:Uncharacterized protein n=1 Tax=Boletus reticuloceps TaxID=495285 RepID=A0A8I2YF96_9AGAM|nr:hypothetical protein JVT61DRAFT_10876 [Boletus reticuloceps]